ncbi:MAG: VWA domain-containing protein [Azoarcus sp.]|jgi:Ca-activated chloride channel family protein|nr:VWA domain-containing protein [Azoarcus sp.]
MKTFFRSMKMSILAAFALAGAAVLPNQPLHAAEPVQLRVELDRGVLSSAAKETAVVKISLAGLHIERPEMRPPVNLALVIDRSGSMGGEKIEQARTAAIEAVRRLSGDDIVSVVAFDDKVKTLVPATRAAAQRDKIERAIQRIEDGGNTALYAGVVEGARQLRENLGKSGYTHRVILLSDGQANVGPSSADKLGKLGAKLAGERIAVSTIGLGLGYDEDLMARLALKSEGNTYFAKNAAALSDIFRTELGDVLNVVAREVKIIIRFPDGVRPLRFIGREGAIRGQNAELTIGQIYGGQEKFALVEAEVSTAKDGESREIAAVSATFEDARTQEKFTQNAAARVRFSADKAAVVQSANHKVQADYAEAAVAAAKDEAIKFSDAGQQDAAAARLRKTVDTMQKLGETYGNDAVVEISKENAALATQIKRDGIDNAQRKTLRASSTQTVNQQGKKK